MTNLQKRNLALCLALALLLVATALLAAVGIATTPTVQAATTSSVDSYYANLNTDFTGEAFRTQLAKLITDTHKKQTSYDGLKDVYKQADVDLSNKNKIKWFYTGTSVSFSDFGSSNGATNREHVWPKDGGKAFPEKNECGSDAHHLRPTEAQLNSTRGSRSYDVVPQVANNIVKENGSSSYGDSSKGKDALCYASGSFFYPAAGYRGATARILMYVQTRWGNNYNLTFVDGSGSCKTIGDFTTLYQWHLDEPPTEEEIYRNNIVAEIQGNRNPFIDHPEYAYYIYSESGSYFGNNKNLADVIKQKTAAKDTYGNLGGEKPNPTPTETYVSYVSVDGTAKNTVYQVGAKFNPDGLTVDVTYSNGTVEKIEATMCKWLDANTGLVTLSAGTTAVVCRYNNCDSAKINGITVNAITTGQKSISITRTGALGAIKSSSSYAWHEWTIDGISGKAFICSSKKESIQFNSDKESCFLYNSVPLTGGIKSVTVKGYVAAATGEAKWELMTSATPYAEKSGAATDGTSQGTKIINKEGVTWELDGKDEYFALNYIGKNACYVDEIVITYGATSGESGATDSVKLDKLSARVKIGDTVNVGATASGTAAYVSSDVNVATVDSQGTIKAIGKGVATITVTCGTAKAQFLVVVAEQGGTIDPDPTPTTSPNDQTDEYPPIGCFGVVSAGGICAMMVAVMAAFVATKKR